MHWYTIFIDLSREIEEEDIIGVIWGVEPNKARGPDGFSIHFFCAYWSIIKHDLR
jgi:hypothetical protein